jgi:hypothetical protein
MYLFPFYEPIDSCELPSASSGIAVHGWVMTALHVTLIATTISQSLIESIFRFIPQQVKRPLPHNVCTRNSVNQ